jgi:hypothetical protein
VNNSRVLEELNAILLIGVAEQVKASFPTLDIRKRLSISKAALSLLEFPVGMVLYLTNKFELE